MCKDMNPIGSVYCNASRNPSFKRGIYDAENGVRCLKSEQHDTAVVLEVKVKEATKQGYSIARGGARCRQPLDAGKQDKKRASRGRYGKYIRHKLQSGNLR